jgi:hypothetical protein
MKAKGRNRIKLLEYFANPENEFVARNKICQRVLGYTKPNQLYSYFSPSELSAIEREGLEMRRKKYSRMLSEVDRACFREAMAGKVDAMKLAYQRFDGWGEKRVMESKVDLKIRADLTDNEREALKKAAAVVATEIMHGAE